MNVDVAIKSLENFITAPGNKAIALDYLYLGLTKIKKGTSADGLAIDAAAFNAGLVDIKKAVEMEPLAVQDLSEVGKKLFTQKLYKEAASIFEFGANIADSKTYLDDNVYYGISVYYANANKTNGAADAAQLAKAEEAFDRILVASPTYDEAYLYKGRINNLLEKDDLIIKNYEEYITRTTAKGAEELAKPATVKKMIEAYNSIGASYANTDKVKAVEYFNKTLVLDPANAYASQSVKALK